MKFCRVFLTIFDLRIKFLWESFDGCFSLSYFHFFQLQSKIACTSYIYHRKFFVDTSSNYWSKSHTVCYQYMRCTFLPQQRTLSRIEKVCVKYILQLLRKRLNLVMYQESLSMGILKYRNCRTKKMSGKSRKDLCNFYWKQLLALNVA